MAVTVKIKCTDKTPYGDQTGITFQPDYQDGRNKEWAAATPSLTFGFTVKGAVADQFEVGAAHTLTIEKSDDQPGRVTPE